MLRKFRSFSPFPPELGPGRWVATGLIGLFNSLLVTHGECSLSCGQVQAISFRIGIRCWPRLSLFKFPHPPDDFVYLLMCHSRIFDVQVLPYTIFTISAATIDPRQPELLGVPFLHEVLR